MLGRKLEGGKHDADPILLQLDWKWILNFFFYLELLMFYDMNVLCVRILLDLYCTLYYIYYLCQGTESSIEPTTTTTKKSFGFMQKKEFCTRMNLI